MGMKFAVGAVSKSEVLVTLVGDGASTSAALAVSSDPFNLSFNKAPVGILGPAQVSFSANLYTLTYAIQASPPVLTISVVAMDNAPASPPSGTTTSFTMILLYQG